ncbi:L-glutamate gamma-semialdehyde dehydrogenase [Phaeacidiphilus oryzae]|uniref:L-glutamate gamma-semialdehyde dehydrogenase n=1 Tax=Phaeacidiphilus oryzae TaxID=348818 RepID=UPI00055C1DFC|nr:L-glutamate gamma-semialdehyde dehydrogenase [Phaeacidiphilus oryzae]
MDAVTQVPAPVNEPVHSYAPGTPERARLEAELKRLGGQAPVELPMVIGGERRMGGGAPIDVVQPHRHAAKLGVLRNATQQDAQAAIDAALAAAPAWRALSFDDRAAVFLRAADLLAGPWRETLAAATMLGQSKTAQQAEIDTPCELVDFLRFNVHYARQILAQQPISSPGVWNRMDHRPLEGFVYAITPFNFTAIAGNLPTAPALMGNVVVWKPSPTQQFAAGLFMDLLTEAGLPAGVINMVTGDGIAVSEVALEHRDLAGIHFTGSTKTFQYLWKTVGQNIEKYRTYPRLVGETGGKDFVFAHPSADPAVLKTALTRGSFEYQGQKCSASSRAYVPASVWERIRDEFAAEVDGIAMGDVTDLSNFIGAVIDARAFEKNKAAIDRAKADPKVTVLAGGEYDDSVGYFVRPTVLVCEDPAAEYFREEYFGPVLAVHVYQDEKWEEALDQMESFAPYGLTGSIIANDRAAVTEAAERLRYAAGNFYVNDKSTGAVVGQQPFGGGRASGTNDKAGSLQNLLRWTSPRAIKEALVPPTDYRYPHMG